MLFKAKKKSSPTTTSSPDRDGGSSSSSKTAAMTAQEKAKARRAQVRKAQIEHRQRKANYVKQLEMDIARIRDLIATAQMESRVIQSGNEAMRSRLAPGSALGKLSLEPTTDTEQQQHQLSDDMDLAFFGDFLQIDSPDDVTFTLDMDEAMNRPIFQISGHPAGTTAPVTTHASSSSLSPTTAYSPPSASGSTSAVPTSPPSCPNVPNLTPEQAQQVINFILALEHVCWNHFTPAGFDPTTDPTGPESGHTFTASSLALQSAPPEVFEAMKASQALWPLPATEPPPPVSWQCGSTGLTLKALHGLASNVNTSELDLTPVQAWFELAERYPVGLLLRGDVESALRREFVGVVYCPHYGASIEREAFESIVARVVEPEVAGWMAGVAAGNAGC